jgi:hypothetical protein
MSVAGMSRSRIPLVGSTLVAAQRWMRFVSFRRRPDELSADKVELGPCVQAFDLEVAAKAQRVDRRADHVLDRGDAREVDERNEAAAGIGEAEALGSREQLRWPAQLARQVAPEEGLDRKPPLGGRKVAARRLAAGVSDDERAAVVVVARPQPRQGLVPHQHQELDLGLMLRVGGVESGRAVLDRVEAVAWEIGASREVGAQEALRGEPFHRVSVQGDDAQAHDGGIGPIRRPVIHLSRKRSPFRCRRSSRRGCA